MKSFAGFLGLVLGCFSIDAAPALLKKWERGVAVHAPDEKGMVVWLWFYEWNMFSAATPGQHTRGQWCNRVTVNKDGNRAIIDCRPNFQLEMKAVVDGAELSLHATNKSGHDWPELAGIIACFNPGPADIRNMQFANKKTFFHGPNGLVRLQKRNIHFNTAISKAVEAEAKAGKYIWSDKWPKGEPNATVGLLVRESTNNQWVTGIAWERFMSSQGHNPWQCMHLGIHLGPLPQGKSRTVSGRIYLFKGKKENLLERYLKDFHGSVQD